MKLHRQVLERHAREILSALQIVCEQCRRTKRLSQSNRHKKAVEAVKELSDFPFCRIGFFACVFCGDEVVAIYEVTGKGCPGRLPLKWGCI